MATKTAKIKRTLVLDFDGVLHSYKSGWTKANVVADDPTPGALEFLEDAVEEFSVAVLSARSHQPGGMQAMIDWCCKHFGYEITGKIDFPLHKPPAFVTLDDRAITFRGVWPTMAEINNFQTWTKEAV